MKCRECPRETSGDKRTCEVCLGRYRRRYQRNKHGSAEYIERVHADCMTCGGSFPQEHIRQVCCSPECQRARDLEYENYRPIDELLDLPRNRILRLLRWFDWVGSRAIAEHLELSIEGARMDPRRDAHDHALYRLVVSGHLEKRNARTWWSNRPSRPGSHCEYRLTAKGRAEADLARFGRPTPRTARAA